MIGQAVRIKVKDFDEIGVYFDKNANGWINQEIDTFKGLGKRRHRWPINAAHNASHVAGKIGFCGSRRLRIQVFDTTWRSDDIPVDENRYRTCPMSYLNQMIRSVDHDVSAN